MQETLTKTQDGLTSPNVANAIAALAKERFMGFTMYMSSWWIPAWFHKDICTALEDVERGDCKRLLIQLPPRAGKSELFSVHFPAYFLGKNPDKRVIHTAYGSDLSNLFSRRVRNMVRDDERFKSVFPRISVSADAQSITQWELARPNRGGFRSVGIGGGITGHGFHLAVADDLVKGAEAAESQIQRDSLWDWWQSEFMTRQAPDAAIVLGGTPWHEDDIYHRALQQGDWRVIKIPARNELGLPYWPERFSDEALKLIEQEVGQRTWNALYMLSPTGSSGLEFKAEWFNEPWTVLPPLDEVWTRWDMSLKENETNDRTAGITVARGKDGLLYGVSGIAGHWSGDVISNALETSYMDNTRRFGGLYKGEFVEDTAAGALMIQRWRGSRVNVVPVKVPKVGKLMRARSVAPLVEARRFRPPSIGNWWSDIFLPEILSFPLSAHDDCLDVFVGAMEKYGSVMDDLTSRVMSGTERRFRRPV